MIDFCIQVPQETAIYIDDSHFAARRYAFAMVCMTSWGRAWLGIHPGIIKSSWLCALA
jgi:hypothetical protein